MGRPGVSDANTSNSSTLFTQTYNTHAGCDIIPTINGIVVGNVNGVSFSTTREKVPVYTMGSVDPVSYGRGKRGHAGSIIFTNFDRHALYDVKAAAKSSNKALEYYRKGTDIPSGGRSKALDGAGFDITNFNELGASKLEEANYSDQIPPFTLTLTGQNEYGSTMVMAILGVELINEGSGVSIDDIVVETQMTFVARAILPWRPLFADNMNGFDSNIMSATSPIPAIRQAFLANQQAKLLDK